MDENLRILLVEDNPGDRDLLEEMILEGSLKDSKIEYAEDLSTAVHKIQQVKLDIILLDLGLPDSTGINTLIEIKEPAQKIPIIVLTGLDDEEVGLAAINLGAQDYLVKGHVDSQMLSRIMRYSIERKKTNKRIAHLNRVLRSIRDVNQLIVKERDVDQLIKETCKILTETRGYLNACIVLIDKKGKPFKTSFDKSEVENEAFNKFLKSETWKGVCMNALNEKGIYIIKDSQAECGSCPLKAESVGIKAISMTLEYEGTILGIFSVSIPKNIEIDAEEEGLIEEVAGDISFALYTIEMDKKRSRAEQSLIKSEREKSVILDSSPTLVAYHDLDHNIIWANKTACESAHVRFDEVIGKKCYEVWALRKQECENCPVRKSWETGENVKGEISTLDGRHWMVSAGPVFDDNGKVIGAVESTLDITEKKIIGLKLERNENMLRQIIDTAPNCIFVKNRDGKYLLVNNLMAKLHNTTPEKLVGKYDHEIGRKWFETVGYDEFRKSEREAIDSNKTLFIPEDTFTYQDGSVRWFQTTKIPFEFDDHEKCLLIISIDITQMKMAEEALMKAQERYEKAEESAHLGHWEMDIATGESIWSDEFYRICGYEPGTFSPNADIGMKSIHPDDRPKASEAVKEAIEQKKPYDIEKRIIRPSGEIRWVHSIGKIIFDNDQNPVKLQGSFLDITERKKAENLQETFYKISNAVNTTENIQDLYSRIQQYLGNVIDTKNFYIALYDNKKIFISFGFYADESFEDKNYIPHGRKFGKGLTEYVLSTGKPLFATREMQDIMAKNGDIEIIGIRSEIWMGVPLEIENETIGVLAVQSYNDPDLYSKDDIDILNFVSQEIALAINRKQTEEKIKKELKEKELLLREIHHRTKNNLQTICGLLQLQEYAINTKEDAVKGFEASQDRIRAMSSAYEILLGSDYMSEVTLGEYITLLSEQIKKNYDLHDKINITFSCEEATFDTEKLSKLGLVVNEILINSMKYAFKDREKGNINIELKEDKENVLLNISDDGIGIPKEVDIQNTSTLGLSLVDMLMFEFDGTYSVDTENGTCFRMKIPKKSAKH